MTRRKILFLLIALVLCLEGRAQFQDFENGDNGSNNNSRNSRYADRLEWFWQHITFGGNIGLGFGTNSTHIEINPCVGYRFNEYVTAGMTGTYVYYRWKSRDYKTYGGGLYAEAYPFEFLTLHAETQWLNFDDYWNNSTGEKRRWDNSVLVGGGYRKQLSDVVYINIMLLFNLNSSSAMRENVFGSNPIVRMNIMF